MQIGQPSRTAQRAAAHRAVHQLLEQGRIFHDPLAVRILGESPRTLEAEAVANPGQRGMRLFIAARTRFAETAVAASAKRGVRQLVVLGADTAVVIDDDLLGKPRDRADALAMLARLSGRWHQVLTAVAVASANGLQCSVSSSEVRFRTLLERECAAYWDSGEPRDKAGAYAIQGLGATFVQELRGSYSGVVGLPLFETAQLLAAAGVPVWGLARPPT